MGIFELLELFFYPDVVIERWAERAKWAGVPDGALSRAQPPGNPEPTDASLSRADLPEEDQPRLAISVDDQPTTEEAVVKTQI